MSFYKVSLLQMRAEGAVTYFIQHMTELSVHGWLAELLEVVLKAGCHPYVWWPMAAPCHLALDLQGGGTLRRVQEG